MSENTPPTDLPVDPFDGWITPTEASLLLQCSSAWIRQLCDRGELKHTMTPLGRLISLASVTRIKEVGWTRKRQTSRVRGELSKD